MSNVNVTSNVSSSASTAGNLSASSNLTTSQSLRAGLLFGEEWNATANASDWLHPLWASSREGWNATANASLVEDGEWWLKSHAGDVNATSNVSSSVSSVVNGSAANATDSSWFQGRRGGWGREVVLNVRLVCVSVRPLPPSRL